MRLLLTVLLIFSSNLYGQVWNMDIPNPEVKTQVSSSLHYLNGLSSDRMSNSLYKRYGLNTSSGKRISEFMSSRIAVIQETNKSRPRLCKKTNKSCSEIHYSFGGYKFLPVTETPFWNTSFDLSKGQKSTVDGFILISGDAIEVTPLQTSYIPMRKVNYNSYYDIYFSLITMFGVSISEKYIENGEYTFDQCNTLSFSYYCDNGNTGFFIDMANFTESMIALCDDCSSNDMFMLNYLKSSYLMRINNKKNISKSFLFIKNNRSEILKRGLNYDYFEKIYRQSLLM